MHAFPERAKQSRYISSQAWHNFPLQLCSHACRFPARGGKKGWWNARDPFPPTFSIITALPSTLLTKFRSSFSPTISILLGESLTLVLINVRDDETIESKCWSKIVFLFKFLCKLCNFYAYEKKGASSTRASIRSIFQIPYLEIIYMFRKYFNYLFSFQNTWNV